jgi:NTE family protein
MNDDRNEKGGAHRSRALVLGAGGPVGRAWQSGLIAGLIEREIDLGDASLIIGTARSSGKFQPQCQLRANDRTGGVQAAPASLWSDMSELLAAIARAIRSSEPEIEREKIGAFAIEARTVSEEIPSPGPLSPRSGDTPGPSNSVRLR